MENGKRISIQIVARPFSGALAVSIDNGSIGLSCLIDGYSGLIG
jgi:hypothetical protein